jgi:HSP20 family molecular chaperone IbpA
MPGFEKSDISLNLENGYLTIEAKREEKQEDDKNYVRRERNFSCKRSYYVGENVTEEDVKAKYLNGTLEILVPKKKEKEITRKNIAID